MTFLYFHGFVTEVRFLHYSAGRWRLSFRTLRRRPPGPEWGPRLSNDFAETASDSEQPPDRRARTDRRKLTWRTFVQGSITPRRRGGRRADEHYALIDWHEPHLLFLAIMILLLSVTDAFLTLTLLARGATEANPFLDAVLSRYPEAFAGVKMALTGSGIIILVAMARARIFRIIRTSHVIHWCMLGYVGLILYEYWLLTQVV